MKASLREVLHAARLLIDTSDAGLDGCAACGHTWGLHSTRPFQGGVSSGRQQQFSGGHCVDYRNPRCGCACFIPPWAGKLALRVVRKRPGGTSPRVVCWRSFGRKIPL